MAENIPPAHGEGLLRLYRELWRHAAGARRSMAVAMLLLLLSQLFRLLIPFFAGRAINTLQLQGLPGLAKAAVWLSLVFLATVACWIMHGPGRVLERNAALVVRSSVSSSLVEKFLSLPLAWHETSHSGATAHRIEQSSRALFDFAQNQYVYLQNAVNLVGPVIALWLIEPAVGVAALGGLALVSAIIVAYDRSLIRLAWHENEAERSYVATVVDVIGNVVTVHALRQVRGVLALVRRRLEAVYKPLRRSIVVNEAKWGSVDLFSQALACALLILYVWMSARGLGGRPPVPAATTPTPTLPLGNVYMVWEYAQRAGGVIASIATYFQTFARQNADYAAGDTIRAAQPSHFFDIWPVTPEQGAWRRIQVSGLQFRHARAAPGTLSLSGLEFTLERGKRYALIGGSGSGKSTLLRVLAGLYLPESLQLVQDGRRIDQARAAARFLRANSTLIPQDAEVFEGTIAENLELCETRAGVPPVETYPRALEVACAIDFLGGEGQALERHVAEGGANLSGGQRQRVSLARGVVAATDSSLLLLDEPTASLDPYSERCVHDRLFAAFPAACIISSLHRLNLLPRFDEILLLERGRLLARGTFAELEQSSPEFRSMLVAQGLRAA
ncbi:MAG TPA: ABC transporter ATP-binding protein [Nevskia sp.]|nr:ABC transporter ATP-binding protein [Nevskia sp.]